MPSNGNIIQRDRYHIRIFAGLERSGFNSKRLGTVSGCTLKQAICNRLRVDLIEHCPLLVSKAEMIVQLSRIFQRIDLCLAVGPECMPNAKLHEGVHRHDTVAEITFCGRARAYDRLVRGKRGDFVRVEMDSVNGNESLMQEAFARKQFYRRYPILLAAFQV